MFGNDFLCLICVCFIENQPSNIAQLSSFDDVHGQTKRKSRANHPVWDKKGYYDFKESDRKHFGIGVRRPFGILLFTNEIMKRSVNRLT